MIESLFREEEGRKEFESFLSQSKSSSDWQPTEDRFNPVDGYFKLNGKSIVVEIKTRDKKYLTYPTHLMQIDKYTNLTKAKVDTNCLTGLYVNIFGDLEKGIYDTMYIYDIRDMNSKSCDLVSLYANKDTANHLGKTNKMFYEIKTIYAKKFKKINNKWTQIK